MAEFILIDNERLKVMKVTNSLEAAEYWTEILCRNSDTTIDDRGVRRFLSKYTDMELRMIYYNATGKVIPPHTEYSPTLKLVYEEVVQPAEVDPTPVEVLRDILGRDLRHDPVVKVPAPDNSNTQAASAPRAAPKARSGGGAGGSTGGPPKGGTTARVWEIASNLLAEKVGEVDVKELRKAVIDACVAEGINQSTAGTQWSKWKKHQNL